MVFQPASLLLLLFPPLPIADFVLLLTFQNVALPFKTLYILKSFSIQCEWGGGMLGSSKSGKPGASFSNFITRFWTVGNQKNEETKMLIV